MCSRLGQGRTGAIYKFFETALTEENDAEAKDT